MPKNFTNAPSSPHVAVLQPLSPPYIAKGPNSYLTPKEKEARRIQRIANYGSFGGYGSSNTALASAGQFFSPQLSTDFLELPQSLREKREIYRHFYNTDPIVGQAIDLHTELPLSKVRLSTPKPTTCPEGFKDSHDYASYILWFFTTMCDRIKLFQRLVTMVHHYWLEGGIFAYAEDGEVEVPPDVGYDEKQVGIKSIVTETGEAKEEPEVGLIERKDCEAEELEFYKKHYRGWERLILLPIDQVKITTYSFTDKMRIELIPAERDRALISQAKSGDEYAEAMVQEMPAEVREHLESGKLIPLGTDPYEGSFCFYLSGRRGAGEDLGQSILDRCHLPGTLILAKREEVIQQIPIEDLDPDTDLVLSAAGRWQEFEVGVRKISEPVVVIKISKVCPSVACTEDHKYRVLRDNNIVDIKAGEIEPGDYLQVPSIPLTETTTKFDLASFVNGLSFAYTAKRSGNSSILTLAVTDVSEDYFTLDYMKGETNPRKLGRLNDLNNILEWAETLEEPVRMRSAQACEKFGIGSTCTLKELRRDLVQSGYGVTVTKSKQIIFPPNTSKIRFTTEIHNTVHGFSRWLNLDENLGYTLGYFLGDGYISSKTALTETFNLNYSEKSSTSILSMQKIHAFLESLGGSVKYPSGNDGYQLVSCNNDIFSRWVSTNFGYTCEDKHLPEWIYDAPKEFLLALLRGFVDSDGDVCRKENGGVSVRLSNSNAFLSDQLLLLCLSLGIPASRTKPAESRWVKQADGSLAWSKPMYAIHFTHGPSVKNFFDSGFLAKRQDPDIWKDGRSGSRHVFYEGTLFYRVSEVTKTAHSGLVYSLNVHEDHTFFASWAATKNCLRVLYYRDKLRQAQTQIASRAMTPKRIVWGDRISEMDVLDLREQVDLALVDPDYSIVTNYEVHWEEMGAKDRLLDLSAEYEITDKQLHAGLGVTESLLSGETLYAGDRLKLEVINTRYLFLREMLQDYVENYLFKPVAQRKGFVEKNAWGGEVLLYPRLSFTRLPLRDSQDTYDALFNLYQKGSIDISLILDMFNIDPDDTKLKLEKDMFTVNDALFNEILRGVYQAVAQKVVDETDVADKIISSLKLKMVPKPEGEQEGRF